MVEACVEVKVESQTPTEPSPTQPGQSPTQSDQIRNLLSQLSSNYLFLVIVAVAVILIILAVRK